MSMLFRYLNSLRRSGPSPAGNEQANLAEIPASFRRGGSNDPTDFQLVETQVSALISTPIPASGPSLPSLSAHRTTTDGRDASSSASDSGDVGVHYFLDDISSTQQPHPPERKPWERNTNGSAELDSEIAGCGAWHDGYQYNADHFHESAFHDELRDLDSEPVSSGNYYSLKTSHHIRDGDPRTPSHIHGAATGPWQLLPAVVMGTPRRLEFRRRPDERLDEQQWEDSDEEESPWASDYSAEPADWEKIDSPLWVARKLAVAFLLIRFAAHTEACQSSSKTSHGNSTPSKGASSRPPGKRSAEDGMSESMGTPSQNSVKRTRKTGQEKGKTVLWACPFYKKDSRRYRTCGGHLLTSISYVKQHLKRSQTHRIPFFCPVCMAVFGSEEASRAHIRERSCEQRPEINWEGITEAQRRALGRRMTGVSHEEQWYAVFGILFPDHPPPSSPYIDAEISEDLLAYHTFATENTALFMDFLTAQGFAVVRSQAVHDPFAEAVIAEGFRALYERFDAERRAAGAERQNEQEGDAANSDERSADIDDGSQRLSPLLEFHLPSDLFSHSTDCSCAPCSTFRSFEGSSS